MAITIELYRYSSDKAEKYTLAEFLSRPMNTKKEWNKKTKDGKEWFATRYAHPIVPYRLKLAFGHGAWELDGKDYRGRHDYLIKTGEELAKELDDFLRNSNFCAIGGTIDPTDDGNLCEVDVGEEALSATVTVMIGFEDYYQWCDESMGGPDNLDEFTLRALCEYLAGVCDDGDGNPTPIEIPQTIGYVRKWEADKKNAVFHAHGTWEEA